jgi:hypothetical protein
VLSRLEGVVLTESVVAELGSRSDLMLLESSGAIWDPNENPVAKLSLDGGEDSTQVI